MKLLSPSDLNPDPVRQFEQWYEDALNADESDPAAMTLSTASKAGRPSARMVLYKGMREGDFLIFTNYESRKAKELLENPYAALTFYWPTLYRQVRVEGSIKKLSQAESNHYFQTRSYESQLSAWASPQSQVIDDRDGLVAAHKKYQAQFPEGATPCPEFWGGFRLAPEHIEFWIGQSHRLHDRFSYDCIAGAWEIKRLAP